MTHHAPAFALPIAAAMVEATGTVKGTTRIVDRALALAVSTCCWSLSGYGRRTRSAFRLNEPALDAPDVERAVEDASSWSTAPCFFGLGRVEGTEMICCESRTP